MSRAGSVVSSDLFAADFTLRSLLFRLWGQLGPRRHIQLLLIVLLMLISGLAEILSLAAVLPFLSVLANPESLWSQSLVQQFAPRLGFVSSHDMLLPMTLLFSGAALFSALIRLLLVWVSGRLTAAIGSDLSVRAYLHTLYQPYAVHVARNSSSLITSIGTDVSRVISSVLNPLLSVTASGLVVLGLVATLLVINGGIAVGAAMTIVLVYALATAISKRPLKELSKRQVVLNRKLVQALQEGLGSIRDVLLDSSQRFFVNTYLVADKPLRLSNAEGSFLSTYPRLLLEPVGMITIAFVGYVLVKQGGLDKALPLLGALALGAQRLLPMAQKIYEGWAQILHSKESLSSVMALLAQPLPPEALSSSPRPLQLRQSIRMKGVHFGYVNSQKVLSGVNLEIHKGERIGFIGSTGSGKSTLVDLIMGLLEPTEGRTLIDGKSLHDPLSPGKLAAWRSAIAHVPQSIYLADSTIAENIAFGISRDQIDQALVRKVAAQAQLAGFIESSPEGYNTFVGERGVRLSGGQRQRIGIARALYKQAQVLVLDEATSALDTATEKAVMEAIEGLGSDVTILMIAHRLSTIQRCDRIVRLDRGLVVASGPPSLIFADKP